MTKTFPRAAALAAFIAAGFLAAPAQASLPGADLGGTIAGGSFAGVRLGPKSEASGRATRSRDVAGEQCLEIVAERPARDGGQPELQRVRVCR